MNKPLLTICIFLISTAFLAGQQSDRTTQQSSPEKPSPAPATKTKGKDLPFTEKKAREILDAAEGEFAAYDPADRAVLCHQTARGMMKYNKEQARELLHHCIAATQELSDEKDESDKEMLQGWIVQLLLTYGPEEGETLLPEVIGRGKERVRGELINAYVTKKNWDRAEELVRGVQPADEGFPYSATANLMTHLPEEQRGEVASLFSFALNDYHQRKAVANTISSEDMATLIVRFRHHVSPDTVMAAVDEVLSKAKESDDLNKNKFTISVGNKDGAATFSSNYEYRAFQMLPIIKELDEGRAQVMFRDLVQMKALMGRYPNGMQSLGPTMSDMPLGENEHQDMSLSLSDSNEAFQDPDAQLRVLMRKQVDDIIAEADKFPRQAISQAMNLPMKMYRAGEPRPRALEGIAQSIWKKNPSAAKDAINELVKVANDVDYVQGQLNYLVSATKMLFNLEDKDAAAKVIEQGMALGKKQYALDTKADDPNKAAKPFWTAAAIWRQFIQLSRKIDDGAPLENLKDIQDPEIQLFTRITLANAWLGLGDGVVTIETKKKSGNDIDVSDSN